MTLIEQAIAKRTLAAFLGMYVEAGASDLCCFEVQAMLLKHGMVRAARATAADCDQEWAIEEGIEPGDSFYKFTPLMQELLTHDQH